MSRVEMKEQAKAKIKGFTFTLFLVSIVASLLPSVFSFIPFLGAIITILFLPFLVFNEIRIYQKFTILDEKPSVDALFKDFQTMWSKTLVLYLLMGLFTFLWSLLLIVPGIIKGLSYSAAPYIMAANPEISPMDAIKQSQELMEGHKSELFVLILSFIGWELLACVTCGLLYIWLIPYMTTTMILFYESLRISPKGYDMPEMFAN